MSVTPNDSKNKSRRLSLSYTVDDSKVVPIRELIGKCHNLLDFIDQEKKRSLRRHGELISKVQDMHATLITIEQCAPEFCSDRSDDTTTSDDSPRQMQSHFQYNNDDSESDCGV